MPTQVLNAVDLYYRCVGDGPDIVLIHGMAANHGFWNVAVLLPLAREYRVTTYDLRGHGKSGIPPSGYTSAHMAADLHALLDHLRIPRAHLIGHSYGGTVALHYAVLHPERVASLTVADSRVRAFQPVNRLQDWPDWKFAQQTLQELGLHIPDDETEVGLRLLEAAADPKWRQARQSNGTERSLFVPFGRWGNQAAERWLKLLQTTTIRQEVTDLAGLTLETLSSIRHPTLAIYGQRSRTLPSCYGLQLHLPNCRTLIVPESGHFHPMIQPTFFVNSIRRFLSSLEPSRTQDAVDAGTATTC